MDKLLTEIFELETIDKIMIERHEVTVMHVDGFIHRHFHTRHGFEPVIKKILYDINEGDFWGIATKEAGVYERKTNNI